MEPTLREFLGDDRRLRSDLLGRCIVANNVAQVRALLAAGVSPDCKPWRWDSALFLAVRLRRIAIARALLTAGASPAPSSSGRSPLTDALQNKSKKLIKLLLGYKANKRPGSESSRA